MECGPCVIYERRGLRGGFPSLLYEEFMKEWKKREIV